MCRSTIVLIGIAMYEQDGGVNRMVNNVEEKDCC